MNTSIDQSCTWERISLGERSLLAFVLPASIECKQQFRHADDPGAWLLEPGYNPELVEAPSGTATEIPPAPLGSQTPAISGQT